MKPMGVPNYFHYWKTRALEKLIAGWYSNEIRSGNGHIGFCVKLVCPKQKFRSPLFARFGKDHRERSLEKHFFGDSVQWGREMLVEENKTRFQWQHPILDSRGTNLCLALSVWIQEIISRLKTETGDFALLTLQKMFQLLGWWYSATMCYPPRPHSFMARSCSPTSCKVTLRAMKQAATMSIGPVLQKPGETSGWNKQRVMIATGFRAILDLKKVLKNAIDIH